MAKPSIALSELIEKGGDVDFVREMLQYAPQRLMEIDVEELCGLPYGERGPGRQNAGTASATASGRRAPARFAGRPQPLLPHPLDGC